MFMFGSAYPIGKIGINHFPPLLMSSLRVFFLFLFILPFFRFSIPNKNFKHLLLFSFVMGVCVYAFLYLAIDFLGGNLNLKNGKITMNIIKTLNEENKIGGMLSVPNFPNGYTLPKQNIIKITKIMCFSCINELIFFYYEFTSMNDFGDP